MTKYTSNAQYERDKKYLIDVFEQEKLWGERILKIKLPEDSDCNKVIDLLKQSKWNKADETKKESKGGFFWDDDDDDSTFWAV